MMAIGAGALLAALTIDLVAVSVEKGHFYPLASRNDSRWIIPLFSSIRLSTAEVAFFAKTATILTHITAHQNNTSEKVIPAAEQGALFP